MFMGVHSHRQVLKVDSYAKAQRVLAASQLTPTGKKRKPKADGFPLGTNRKGVTWVREYDGSIFFRLYNTDVVVWHPDNSFEVENFGSVTTSSFASRFTPWGIHLHHPSRDGGHCMISYPTSPGQRWAYHELVQGDVVRFVPHKEVWLPDLETCDDVRFPVLNTKLSRELAKRWDFRKLEAYLLVATRHIEIEHKRWDVQVCDEALAEGDYRKVVEHMPLVADKQYYGNYPEPVPVRTRGGVLTKGCVDRLRLALYHEWGAIERETFRSIDHATFERRMALVRRLDALGCREYWMGPKR